MELSHWFTVPVDPDQAWAEFEDIESVAECFPGAVVTSVEGDRFQGAAKVKLGPIAMQYTGTGSFLERDAEARRMVLKADGRDKRGNGTAGATITATFLPEGNGGTRVEVLTDLQITGKAAQFGRQQVVQDVSDKLLGQFVECLQARVTSSQEEAGEEAVPDPAPDPLTDPATDPAPDPLTAPAADPDPASDEVLDLGATVLPVLVRSYGPRLAGIALVLLAIRRLVRRR